MHFIVYCKCAFQKAVVSLICEANRKVGKVDVDRNILNKKTLEA